MKTTTTQTADKLPDGIKAGDLKFASYTEQTDMPYENRQFELWFTTGVGWVIPTLLIGKASARYRQTTDRTYAVTLDGKLVRVGKGPHVTKTLTVYVRLSRIGDLQKFLDIRRLGEMAAGQVRDRISSRRAHGQIMRAEGRSYWNWND